MAVAIPNVAPDGAQLAQTPVVTPPAGFTDALPYHLGGMVIGLADGAEQPRVRAARDSVLDAIELGWLDAYKAAAKRGSCAGTGVPSALVLSIGLLAAVGLALRWAPGSAERVIAG